MSAFKAALCFKCVSIKYRVVLRDNLIEQSFFRLMALILRTAQPAGSPYRMPLHTCVDVTCVECKTTEWSTEHSYLIGFIAVFGRYQPIFYRA